MDPSSLQPRAKGSPVGGSGGASDKTAPRSAMASGAQAEDGAAAGLAADKVWWRVSDTHVPAVDLSRGQAHILTCERRGGRGGCWQRGVCCISAQPLVCYLTLALRQSGSPCWLLVSFVFFQTLW